MCMHSYYYLCSEGKIVFYVASRGHHADVGGIAPGSMPPLSKVREHTSLVSKDIFNR
jgi:N-methylhydantoinase B/oxoprolinase/acetone carboxylase alpha subunit